MVRINKIVKMSTPKIQHTATPKWQNFELHQAKKTTKKAQKAANDKVFKEICAEAVKSDIAFYTVNNPIPYKYSKNFYDFSLGDEIIQTPAKKFHPIVLFKK